MPRSFATRALGIRQRTIGLQTVGRLVVLAALVLSILVLDAEQAMASPSLQSRPAGIPRWVPPIVDSWTPATETLPAALTETSNVRGTVVSPKQAAAVLSALWNLRAQAFRTDDRSLMNEFETGPALEADEVTCGCNSRGVRGPIDAQSLLVPRQKSFPAAFLAEVKTTLSGGPYVQYLVIVRQSRTTPWEVASDPGDSGELSLDRAKIGRGGFDDGETSSADAEMLPSELASYWHTWTEENHAPRPSLFAPGRWTTKAGAAYGKDPSGSLNPANKLVGYNAFQGGGPNEAWTFKTATGSITCGVVRWQTIWTDPGGGIYQDPAQHNWGASVSPGSYEYEVETQIMQPCFIRRPGVGIAVVSGLGDPDTDQAVHPLPATPTSPTPIVQV